MSDQGKPSPVFALRKGDSGEIYYDHEVKNSVTILQDLGYRVVRFAEAEEIARRVDAGEELASWVITEEL